MDHRFRKTTRRESPDVYLLRERVRAALVRLCIPAAASAALPFERASVA